MEAFLTSTLLRDVLVALTILAIHSHSLRELIGMKLCHSD